MSEAKQPFTEQVTRANRPAGNSDTAKRGWIASGILAAALIAALLMWAGAVGKLRGLARVQSQLDEANASLANALAENDKDKDQIATLQSQVADLQKDKDTSAQMSKSLEDEMRSDLESKDVTISKLQGKLTVNILDRVLFDSGEAILKPDGETVLQKIAALLAAHPTLKIHVIGHTDNVPIRARFASNWELSAARALAAVHFLTEKQGVIPAASAPSAMASFVPLPTIPRRKAAPKTGASPLLFYRMNLAAADTVSATKSESAPGPQPKSDAPAAPEPPVNPPAM